MESSLNTGREDLLLSSAEEEHAPSLRSAGLLSAYVVGLPVSQRGGLCTAAAGSCLATSTPRMVGKTFVLDRVRQAYEDILNDWAGWGALIWLAGRGFAREGLSSLFCIRETTTMIRAARVTKFVNAAAVAGTKNDFRNQAIIVEP